MNKESVYLGHTGVLNFPREFGIPERFIVNNKEEYLKAIQEYNGRKNCYALVYRLKDSSGLFKKPKEYNSAVIDKTYIDIDSNITPPSIWMAYRETKILIEALLEKDVIPRVYFSGNKGFNVYIDYPSVKLKYPKETLRKFVDNLENSLNLTLVDSHPKGDLSRISRIPNTKHMTSGLYCVPFEIDEFLRFFNVNEILYLAKKPRFDFQLKKQPSKVITQVLKQIDEDIEKEIIRDILRQVANKRIKMVKSDKNNGIRSCIQKLIYEAKNTNLEMDHLPRLAILFEVINSGWKIEDIVDIFSKQTDFDSKLTRYYIKHAIESGYKPFKCKTIKNDLKSCLEDCKRSKHI